ncbi:HlyD family efflux transporter periplasmic adaptor subunit [Argonema galeatum]|uniref:HlyD family efflux transporter periplasmic adaptor subunit n=1 Tax=Argonema galeatum TaxID=2942762 RepID=UPI002011F2C9|nr:HlyD family efflux transporter periplasmic adaptor subunit [Argonema galeatum]MCL1468039.1 HlyD family secretion protein [Argonema galeatum A003/A1]
MVAQTQVSGRTVSSAKAEVDRLQRDYEERRVTTLAELQAAQANLMAAKAKLRSAEALRDRYKPLAEAGAISESLLMEKQQAVQELEFAVKVAEANMQRAQAALNPGTAAIAKATEQIAEEQARGEATQATLNKERSQIEGRLIEIQNQLNRDRKQLQQIENDLSASVVRSPIYGTIIELELRNPGQVVQSGALIAQISPDRAALVVKARVDAQDISQFKSCRSQDISQCLAGFGKAILKFSAYPYPDYGTLYGAVREISADVKTPPEGGKPYYEVTIQPEKPYLLKGNQQYPLQAGMEVSSDIIAKEETVMRFILRKARLLTDV